jgi:hypothetical protein
MLGVCVKESDGKANEHGWSANNKWLKVQYIKPIHVSFFLLTAV